MPLTELLDAAQPQQILRAAAILRAGGLVAFPTETVYGLGAHALDARAVERIFVAKRRPSWDPLIVHVASVEALADLVQVSGTLQQRTSMLAATFWPGPLTLLLPRSRAVPEAVTAGRSQVGVRVPSHPVAQALLRAASLPVAAPSANRFGHTSPTTAQHVMDDLDGRIDAVLDAGPTSIGLESTVLDPGCTPMRVYRAGAVTVEAVAKVTGVAVELWGGDTHLEHRTFEGPHQSAIAATEVTVPPLAALETLPRHGLPSPGVGLRHYAPEILLQLTGPSAAELGAAAERAVAKGERVCILLPADWPAPAGSQVETIRWGTWSQPEHLAAELFQVLRRAERTGATILLCPLPEPGGLREALRDRLLKAAKPR